MPLTIAPIGKQMKVTKVLVDEKTKRHLENLGILTGSLITVVAESGGDLIIKIKDGRVGLNKQIASKIFVA